MQATFLDGTAGRLFAVHHAAAPLCRQRFGLVYLPAFAEEMNRSRRMAALQARRLAALGVDVLLLDPFGTGDSGGDFAEARWETWREDATAAMAWLGARCDGQVGLWGLRVGALLAAEVAADAALRPGRLLLWQPVISGDRFLTQFLRLRVAAGMAGSAGKESASGLRARLQQGEALEIAGYELAPALAEAIAGRDLGSLLEPLAGLPVDLLEVAGGDAPAIGSATQRLLETSSSQGRCVRAHAVSGEHFWSLQEITLAPALLDATEDLFRP